MAGITLNVATSAMDASVVSARINRRRHISPSAGRALEVLGHAIEYLVDEFVHHGDSPSADHPRIEAVQMLMGLNRQIYYECPEVPGFGDRCRALFRLQRT